MHQGIRRLLGRNADHAESFGSRFDDVQDGQHPDVVSVCCSDSRVLHDHLWGTTSPARCSPAATSGTASSNGLTPAKSCRATSCTPWLTRGQTPPSSSDTPAVAPSRRRTTLTGDLSEPPGIEHCIGLLKPRLEAGVEALPQGIDRAGAINRLVEYNVDRQVEFLLERRRPRRRRRRWASSTTWDVYSDRRGRGTRYQRRRRDVRRRVARGPSGDQITDRPSLGVLSGRDR